jgi:broad-specificity NMP kinase
VDGAPAVVEVVGLAGAGKTTLVEALRQRDANVVVGAEVAAGRYARYIVRHLVTFLPTFVRWLPRSRWFNWPETRSMVYLKAWPPALRVRPRGITASILDHGLIFRLAFLWEFGPELTRSGRFEAWWNSALVECAGTLDLVVWLDAPEATLLARVHDRPGGHRIIERSTAEESGVFLARCRRAYEQVLREMEPHRRFRVLRFDTSRMRPEEIAEAVLAEMRR